MPMKSRSFFFLRSQGRTGLCLQADGDLLCLVVFFPPVEKAALWMGVPGLGGQPLCGHACSWEKGVGSVGVPEALWGRR